MKESSEDLSVSFVLLNPEKDIDDSIKRRDWFTGFAISVSYFEHYGAEKIKNYCKTQKIRGCSDPLKRMNVNSIIFILRVLEFINNDIYEKMKKTISERNKLIHPSRKGIDYRYQKEENRAKQLLEEAKECIHKIKK